MQVSFLIAHPFATAFAVLRGTAEAALDFARRGVYVIGWNDLLPHHGAAAALVVCLLAVLLLAPACPIRTRCGFGLLALAIIAPLLGSSLAEYIIWTPPDWPTVCGVQPRYWLPVLPSPSCSCKAVCVLRLRRRPQPAFHLPCGPGSCSAPLLCSGSSPAPFPGWPPTPSTATAPPTSFCSTCWGALQKTDNNLSTRSAWLKCQQYNRKFLYTIKDAK
jgi:hypothetical protein